jgi:pimeloyl-ACP methyl ester carboxylesterase
MRDGRVVPQTGHATLADVARGKARVLIVEKIGVEFLDTSDPPGGTAGASREFLDEHTLERWSAAVSAAMKAACTLDQVDSAKVLVVGHSEGGLVACRVARENPCVTHVAILAGGGPSQLFDLVELSRQGHFARHISDDPDERAEYILREHAKILDDPTSTDQQFLGHPYRRWSSFLASSPMQELSGTDACVYIAQGAQDTAVLPVSAQMLHAQLVAMGKDVKLDWVSDADHSFAIIQNGKRSGDGWAEVLERVADWYLPVGPPASQPVR